MWPFPPKPSKARPVVNSQFQAKLFELAAQQSSAKVVSSPDLPQEKDETFVYVPLEVKDRNQLAGSLETILQGSKIDPDIFLKLYRGGYVFKTTGGAWKITERGKELIDKHKLISPDTTLINGVPCKKTWTP